MVGASFYAAIRPGSRRLPGAVPIKGLVCGNRAALRLCGQPNGNISIGETFDVTSGGQRIQLFKTQQLLCSLPLWAFREYKCMQTTPPPPPPPIETNQKKSNQLKPIPVPAAMGNRQPFLGPHNSDCRAEMYTPARLCCRAQHNGPPIPRRRSSVLCRPNSLSGRDDE